MRSRTVALPSLSAALAVALLAPLLATAGAGGADRGRYCPKGERDAIEVERLVDKRVRVATRMARRHDCGVRVVKRNGRWLDITADLRRDRVNVIVRDRRIKRIHGVY